jgi:hypothetical protein
MVVQECRQTVPVADIQNVCQEYANMIYNEEYYLRDIMLCSPLKGNQSFGEITLVSCLASTLKMEAICSPETSVDFQWTTPRYIAGDRTLHNHCCENLKSYMIYNDEEWKCKCAVW